jgi:integrase
MGFIEKRSGGYRARYRDPLGRLTSKTFTRKADAERWTKEMEVAIERGDWLDPRSAQVPLATWAEEYLSLARRLSPSTQETYERDLRKYILPRFGAYRIGRLPADEIENWLNDEVAAGIAPSSVHRHYRLLRRMLQVAVHKQKLQANPCDRVEPPRVPKTEMTFLTWEQAVDLAEAHQERYRAMIYLAVDSGMRWSELIGPRRARVDLGRRKVRVTEQMIRLKGGKWHRKEPKTPASVRSITMSAVTAELLADHVDRFVVPGPDALVFANTVGSPLISSSFWQHHFSKGLQAAGVSCRFHDLRHTSVALAIAEGAHPKAIQTRMGHSTINVTLDRYGHLFPELDEAIADSFGERLRDARGRRGGGVGSGGEQAATVL